MLSTQHLTRRLRAAIERCGKPQTKIADELGVGDDVVSKWKSGALVPTTKHLLRLPAVLGVDPGWLLTGEGSPDVEEPSDDPQAVLQALKRHLADLATMADDELVGRIRRGLGDAEGRDGAGQR